MKPLAIAGALGGAALGAGIWAAIGILTGYEVGYVAWAVGGLVGVGAKVLGGRGQSLGIVCAALALVGILVGKALTVRSVLPRELTEIAEASFSREQYDQYLHEASEFAALKSEDDHAIFMAQHEYADSTDPLKITAEEVEAFRAEHAPRLKAFHESPPPFEQWRDRQAEAFKEAVGGDFSLTEAVRASLGWLDLVFGALGVATAYRIVTTEE